MLHHDQLQIHQSEKEGITVLDLHGKILMGQGEISLRDDVQSLFDGANRKLTFNFAGVSDIDSAGIGLLLFLAEEYRNAGGKLVLFNVPHSHSKVYETARLELSIEIYRDELDAINSFFPDRTPPRYDILDYVESQTHEDKTPKT